ncbi:MAG: ATP-binding protein [Candidatus Omnitrophica bacterium]|nr:ATP-binding protein [Candidatus Omnitrophota bacterium]
MIERPFWVQLIEKGWKETPIVWLAGVRRSGKTTLAKSFGSDKILYINCDLPATADRVSNPEFFYRNCDKPIVVFDEVHQLKDPSLLLKIGADVFPEIKILATGSSSLIASHKFRDTLTGRKRLVRLTPVLWNELSAFHNTVLIKRLYQGGLPEALLSESKNTGFYREWMDSLFARDIQKLFAFRNPDKFNALFEYVMKQSGGLFEITRAAGNLGISRATVENHVLALEVTNTISILRPFHGGGKKELIKTPKIYGFDTGFISFCRGWDPLRTDDYGILWEHMVLEYLHAHVPNLRIQFWRDASGREVDFVIPHNRDRIDAIECKWTSDYFNPASLKVFRTHYSHGHNYLVCPINEPGYFRKIAGLDIWICSPNDLFRE